LLFFPLEQGNPGVSVAENMRYIPG
jgi:hypothetical protein